MVRKAKWHKVKAPQPWRPKDGDEIVGEYVDTQKKKGQYGEYKVHYIKVDNGSVVYVSGVTTNDLFSLIGRGVRVKLVYMGKVHSGDGFTYKKYELYTEEAISFRIIPAEAS